MASDITRKQAFILSLKRCAAPGSEQAASLLELIQAPPACFAIEHVLRNLHPILELMSTPLLASDIDGAFADALTIWLELTTWICAEDNAQRVVADLASDGIDHQARRPLHGHLDEWPGYCALYYAHPNPELVPRHRHLAAQLLICQAELRSIDDRDDLNYRSALSAAWRVLRLSADPSTKKSFSARQALLNALPVAPITAAEYLASVGSLNLPYENTVHRQSICVALRYAALRTGARRRTSRSGRTLVRQPEVPPKRWAPNAVDELAFSKSESRTYTVDRKRAATLEQEGAAVDELQAAYTLVQPADPWPADLPIDRSPLAHVRRARGIQHGMAMRNQHLPGRWSGVTVFELAMLHNAIFKITDTLDRAQKHTYSNTISNLELAAFVVCVYWTGQPIDEVLRFRFEPPQASVSLAPGQRCYCSRSGLWLIGALVPEYRAALPLRSQHHLTNRTNVLATPVAPILQNFLYQLCANRSGGKIFQKSAETYMAASTAFLAEVNKKFSTRMTLHRLSRDLQQRIFDESRDWVYASLITGSPHPAAEVPLYYAAPRLRDLYNLSALTTNHLTASIFQELNQEVSGHLQLMPRSGIALFGHQLSPGDRTGCRTLPLETAVKRMISEQQRLHSAAARRPGQRSYLTQLHNSLTVYTAIMIAFCSGYRAVRAPVSRQSDVDFTTGFTVISDKDSVDNSHTRLVWLPDLALCQLQAYQRHRELLCQHLRLINSKLADSIQSDAVPFLFLLTADGRMLNVRPLELQKRLEDVFPIPINSGRAYLRDRLRDLHVDGETLRWFMGHWDIGQHPYSPRSSLSPQDLKKQLNGKLDAIMSTDGWTVLRGLAHHG